MPKQANPIAALQHGGYSALTLLPGEDLSSFKRLHRDLIAELRPQGRLEEELVADTARLLWRKQNLANYQIRQISPLVANALTMVFTNTLSPPKGKELDKPVFEALLQLQREKKVAEESADDKEEAATTVRAINDITQMATLNGLLKALEVQDRLDAMIDRCLKRLLFLRGLKSIAPPDSSASPPSNQRRLRKA